MLSAGLLYLIRAIRIYMSLWSELCFIVASWQSQHLSVKKNQKKWKQWGTRNGPWSDPIAFKHISDQTQLRSNRLWSDPIALEPFMTRLKCTRIRLWSHFSDQIDPWSDQLQTMLKTLVCSNFRPDPVISIWEHTGVRLIGSDHKAIWVCTSTGLHSLIKLNAQNEILQNNLPNFQANFSRHMIESFVRFWYS